MMYKLNVCFTVLLLALVVKAGFSQSPVAGVKGQVLDVETMQPLAGVSLSLSPSGINTVSGSKGEFEIAKNLVEGPYTLTASYLGYMTDSISFYHTEGQWSFQNLILVGENSTLDAVVITRRREKESEIALLEERKLAKSVVQKIGSQELSRKGVGDVGEGVTKIVGISRVGNKDLFVRGLGDRYNNVTLNGLPVPSTNPDLKTIPLDIFPTAIVENVGVNKSYDVAHYGDFSGGTIDIATKKFSEAPFFKVSIGTGGNTNTTGRNFYMSSNSAGARTGFLRSLQPVPSIVHNSPQFDSYLDNKGEPGFKNSWSPVSMQAPVDANIAVTAGESFRSESGKQFGYLVHLGYKNDYNYASGISALYNTQQTPSYYYDTDSYQFSTNTTGLLNLNYKGNEASVWGFTGLFVNSSSDDVFFNRGMYKDFEDDVLGRRNLSVQNSLYLGQLTYRHDFDPSQSLSLASSYARTIGGIPDRTQNMFGVNDAGKYYFQTNATSYNHRFFSQSTDQEGSLKAEYKLTFESPSLSSISGGIDGRWKDRVFDARQIDAKIAHYQSMDLESVDQILSPENMGDGFESGTWRYMESYYGPNHYRANLWIVAPYVNSELAFGDHATVLVGLRTEVSRQTTEYQKYSYVEAPFERINRNKVDLLPSILAKYTLNDRSNIVGAFSRTISRPLFVESAPFRYNNMAATAERQGNAYLENGSNYNLDLKYEIYPGAGELMAVSLFGKYLQNPIEMMQVVSSESLFTFVNTDNAVVAGAELEVSRNLSSLLVDDRPVFQNTSLGLNATYMYSKIKFTQDKVDLLSQQGNPVAPTNRERALFGASPYILNADLSYKAKWGGRAETVFTTTYSVFGKRLFVAGSQGAGDIYEMPVQTLNLVANTKLKGKFGLDLSIQNLLNPKAKFQQEFAENNLEFSSIRRGVNYSLSLNYLF